MEINNTKEQILEDNQVMYSHGQVQNKRLIKR